jgi:type VI secretion system protein ImpA
MASTPVLDFAILLAPISGETPTGVDLRTDLSASSVYYAIKDARTAARAAERQLVLDGEDATIRPDWRPVLQHGMTALGGQTKDLEITAYLIEALVRQHGFAGLRDGFRLARELAEQFWDGLYPLPDEDGLETRVAPLTGLNGGDAEGTLINPIARVPLTAGDSAGPFGYWHYQQAGTVGQLVDEDARAKRLQQGAVSLEMFEKAVAETPAAFFTNLVADLTECRDEFARLCAVLDDKCGRQAPPASNIRSALTACLDTVTTMARAKLVEATPPEESPTPGTAAASAAAANGQPTAVGALHTRDDAFRTLSQVAEFFHRNEPHTPISYALEQAVRWGKMRLPELLADLIPDEAARQFFFTRVGILGSQPSSG